MGSKLSCARGNKQEKEEAPYIRKKHQADFRDEETPDTDHPRPVNDACSVSSISDLTAESDSGACGKQNGQVVNVLKVTGKYVNISLSDGAANGNIPSENDSITSKHEEQDLAVGGTPKTHDYEKVPETIAVQVSNAGCDFEEGRTALLGTQPVYPSQLEREEYATKYTEEHTVDSNATFLSRSKESGVSFDELKFSLCTNNDCPRKLENSLEVDCQSSSNNERAAVADYPSIVSIREEESINITVSEVGVKEPVPDSTISNEAKPDQRSRHQSVVSEHLFGSGTTGYTAEQYFHGQLMVTVNDPRSEIDNRNNDNCDQEGAGNKDDGGDVEENLGSTVMDVIDCRNEGNGDQNDSESRNGDSSSLDELVSDQEEAESPDVGDDVDDETVERSALNMEGQDEADIGDGRNGDTNDMEEDAIAIDEVNQSGQNSLHVQPEIEDEQGLSGDMTDAIEPDAECYTEERPEEVKESKTEDGSLEKYYKRAECAMSTIGKIAEFGQDGMTKEYHIAMNTEHSENIKIESAKEIGSICRSLGGNMAEVAIRCFN